jgi:hypothetical protein
MSEECAARFVRSRYEARFGAVIDPCYQQWQWTNGNTGAPNAALGYRGGLEGPLFLEAYLDDPIETLLSHRLAYRVNRGGIVELGCLAAIPSTTLLSLWRDAAATLSAQYDHAVATLTAPLRDMFRRVGMPIIELAEAAPTRIPDAHRWGSYYDHNPVVCGAPITTSIAALNAFAGSRRRSA